MRNILIMLLMLNTGLQLSAQRQQEIDIALQTGGTVGNLLSQESGQTDRLSPTLGLNMDFPLDRALSVRVGGNYSQYHSRSIFYLPESPKYYKSAQLMEYYAQVILRWGPVSLVPGLKMSRLLVARETEVDNGSRRHYSTLSDYRSNSWMLICGVNYQCSRRLGLFAEEDVGLNFPKIDGHADKPPYQRTAFRFGINYTLIHWAYRKFYRPNHER